MPFVDEPLKPVFRRWFCDRNGCGGEMKVTDGTAPYYAEKYPHYCDKCYMMDYASREYPRIAYLSVEGEQLEKV